MAIAHLSHVSGFLVSFYIYSVHFWANDVELDWSSEYHQINREKPVFDFLQVVMDQLKLPLSQFGFSSAAN